MFYGCRCVDKTVKIQVSKCPQAVTLLVLSLSYLRPVVPIVRIICEYFQCSVNLITAIFYLSLGLISLYRQMLLRPLAPCSISCTYFVNIEISHFLHF
jgi:hypothetical protein